MSAEIARRGDKHGKLTLAFPLMEWRNGQRRWVCRCECGTFCTRNAKSIRAHAKAGWSPCCGNCMIAKTRRWSGRYTDLTHDRDSIGAWIASTHIEWRAVEVVESAEASAESTIWEELARREWPTDPRPLTYAEAMREIA